MNYKIIILIIISMAIASCADSSSYDAGPFIGLPESIPKIKSNERAISKLNFEGVWPLKVKNGILGCESKAIYLTINHNTYSLNSFSYLYSNHNNLGWIKLMPNSLLWRTNISRNFNEKGSKDLITAGLKLCKA